jgi:hypothetical protein
LISISALWAADSWADDEKYECDVGWQAFQAGCYRLTSEKVNWDTAQKTCQKMEANLVSLHTLPELEFIINNIKRGTQIMQYVTVRYLNLKTGSYTDTTILYMS